MLAMSRRREPDQGSPRQARERRNNRNNRTKINIANDHEGDLLLVAEDPVPEKLDDKHDSIWLIDSTFQTTIFKHR